MGDHDRRPVLKHHIQPFLDLGLGERIDAGSRLIEDEDGRVLKQHARQGDELALAHRDPFALFTDRRRQPLRQCFQPIAASHARGHGHHLLIGCVRLSIADVVSHRAGKQEGRLRHDAELAAVRIKIEGTDVLAVDEQLAALEFVEARHQLAQARLARARVADQRQGLASLYGQVEVFQHLLIRRITKIQIAEFDPALQARRRPVISLDNARLGVDQGKDAFAGRQAELELAPERGNADQREPEEVDALDEQVKIARQRSRRRSRSCRPE